MGLFKKHKRATKVVTIKGEKFTLIEPSALQMCDYYDMSDTEHKKLGKDSSKATKAKLVTRVNFTLASFCLMRHFNPKMDDGEIVETANNIYRMLCDEITDMSDANDLGKAAEEVAGLKFEQTELPDESLETD